METVDPSATTRSSTRQRILDAARQAVLTGGTGGLRVDQVAGEANANKRMIYHYFGDRDGLVNAVYLDALARLYTAGPALGQGTHAVLSSMVSAHNPSLIDRMASVSAEQDAAAEVPVPADVSTSLQQAARLLLPYLLTMQDQTELNEVEVSATQWIGFCVEIMSLAFASGAPIQFPQAPGTSAFVEISERLLSGEKPRYSLRPDSRPRHR